MNHPAAIAVVTPRDPATNLCAASASLLLLLLLMANVNEASIDASSFLGFFHQFVHNYYTVRSFVRLYFSFSLSNATRERHVILHSLHRFVSLSLSLFLSFSFSLSLFLSLSLKVVVVVRSPCVVGSAGLIRVRARARD